MQLSKSEIANLNAKINDLLKDLKEHGVDSGILLVSWQNENGHYDMGRFGVGNPWAQDGMLSDALDSNLVGTIATELGTYLGEEDDDADAWKDAG